MSVYKNYRFLPRHLLVILAAVVCFLLPLNAVASPFPRYGEIEPNVQFWEKIYATYSLKQAVIHDANDVSKIYEVIELLDSALPGARKINTKAQKRTIKKYENLLKKLSKQKPITAEEKRIAALYKGKYQRRNMGRAAHNVRSQLGQKERFRDGVIQSGTYMKEIKRIFRQYNLPEDLAYLPHVESSFNVKAYSKFGAAGIWQFTRSTGKSYLIIDESIDERLDPLLASEAAAKYLKKSYQRLGDWPLALTSYNYGLSGMLRARKEHGSYVAVFKNYDKGHFKFASKNFYSEFLAALKVAKSLELKTPINMPENVRYLDLPGYTSLHSLSRHLRIPAETIIALNPAFRSATINGEKHIPKGYRLRLPASTHVQKRIASIPSSLYARDQKPSRVHRVQRGESASVIAHKYGVSLKSLMRANNLDQYATIYIKQKLRIPLPPTRSQNPSTKSQLKRQNSKIPTLVEGKKNKPSEHSVKSLPSKDPAVYTVFGLHERNSKTFGYITVQPEESMRLYADLLGEGHTTLHRLNSSNPGDTVTPGQQLLLPFLHVTPSAFEEKRLDFLKETEDDFFAAYNIVGQKYYHVSEGDTLWDLCYNRFDIPLWLLERYNSSINLLRLNRNQKLIIPIVQQI